MQVFCDCEFVVIVGYLWGGGGGGGGGGWFVLIGLFVGCCFLLGGGGGGAGGWQVVGKFFVIFLVFCVVVNGDILSCLWLCKLSVSL